MIKMVDTTQTTLLKTEKPNSFEFGKAGSRFKLYFDTVAELRSKIDELKKSGLIDETEVNF